MEGSLSMHPGPNERLRSLPAAQPVCSSPGGSRHPPPGLNKQRLLLKGPEVEAFGPEAQTCQDPAVSGSQACHLLSQVCPGNGGISAARSQDGEMWGARPRPQISSLPIGCNKPRPGGWLIPAMPFGTMSVLNCQDQVFKVLSAQAAPDGLYALHFQARSCFGRARRAALLMGVSARRQTFCQERENESLYLIR